QALENAIKDVKPDLLLVLADNSLSKLAYRSARKHGLPLAGLFLDWVPILKGHFGHRWTRPALSRWFRRFYGECDLAFCTSDGMQEVLGSHPNSHVIYPMPGRHRVPEKPWPAANGKFRLVYVGSVENFYGRMLCSLIEKIEATNDLEIIVVGPNADWPIQFLRRVKANGIYVGFKPPEEAAEVLAGADALLVVMSFEKEHELFMRTSFTTKFLDYVAFGKPVILWGPDYCTPFRVAHKHGGAVAVNQNDADAIVSACRQIAGNAVWREQLSEEATRLHQTLFNPERLQEIFVGEIEKLVAGSKK
ncbi:MAG TPA: glycosyltransferase, partial [Candidatus Acidoferrum sp.]